jgi:O-methyltransferase involved in polyketide biosynthesis
MSGSDSISPTAHYTGYIWARNGLSHPELSTIEGRILFEAMRPAMTVSQAFGGPSLETYLLARHRAIDVLLEQAIEEHGITQVIEIAAGLSPRGWRFASRCTERLTYVEADLPEMAARKRRALARMGSLSERHRVADVDVLRDEDLFEVAAELDRGQGLAIVTEGLLGYLPSGAVDGIWRRFARVLKTFASGRYISDIHLGTMQNAQVRAFRMALAAFVRGRVHIHFHDPEEVEAALRSAGFASEIVRPAAELAGMQDDPGARRAHILEASTT